MTVEVITREDQIMGIVNGLKLLGYRGDAPIDVIEESDLLFRHRDIEGEVSLAKVFEIAHLLIRETPYFSTIERVVEFMFQEGSFTYFENVFNWTDVGAKILQNDVEVTSKTVIGFIAPNYVPFVNKEALGRSLESRSAVDFGKGIVIHIW